MLCILHNFLNRNQQTKKMKAVACLFVSGLLIVLYSCGKEHFENPKHSPDAFYVWDVEGTPYSVRQIGSQVWTCSNLKVRHFRNGDPIPLITDKQIWYYNTAPACCYYKNDSANIDSYGLLYNFAAVSDPRGICPEGWHVPSVWDWELLIDTLGGSAVAGGKLKEIGNCHWAKPNTQATDSTAFMGLPGGYRSLWGDYGSMKYYGYYWSSTPAIEGEAYHYYLSYDTENICRCYVYAYNAGFSIRMIHD